MKVLVTGANGNLGQAITSSLAKVAHVHAGTRKLDNVISTDTVTAVALDYDAPETYTAATAGVDAVVLQTPSLDFGAFDRLSPFIDHLKANGITRVALVSALGVDADDSIPLRKIELKLIADGFTYTFVRPNFFMENFTSGFARPALDNAGVVVASAGDAALSFVSITDIADVIAKALSEEGHNNAIYTLTGPQALSHGDVADALSAALNKPIANVSLSHPELKAGAMDAGLPESQADFLVMLYTAAAAGYAAPVTEDIADVLGRPAKTFTEVAATLAA